MTSCIGDVFRPDLKEVLDVTGPEQVWIGAGDIASCVSEADEETAQIIDSLLVRHPDAAVFTAGDNVYDDGKAEEYTDCYEPTWGRFLDRTWATLGNREYHLGNADPTFDYFGQRVGPTDLGYYSLDAGDWHVVMLNSGDGGVVPFGAGSAQEQWLRQDLAANNKSCVMAVLHHPRFWSCSALDGACTVESDPDLKPIWDALYEYGVSFVVAGHRHRYERWALIDANGNLDPSGIRQFIVGTGGTSVSGMPRYKYAPAIEAIAPADPEPFGVLKLTLRPSSYDWEFITVSGNAYTDSGTGYCGGSAPTSHTK